MKLIYFKNIRTHSPKGIEAITESFKSILITLIEKSKIFYKVNKRQMITKINPH
jgi:hypothetical protein